MKHFYLICLLSWWFFYPCQGQQLFYKHYTTSDGLADNIVYAIKQDYLGYLWIGTDNGLNRFDGNSFKTYTTENGLPSNYIIDIQENTDHTLWTTAWKGGLSYLKNDTVHSIYNPYKFYSYSRFLIQDNQIVCWNNIGAPCLLGRIKNDSLQATPMSVSGYPSGWQLERNNTRYKLNEKPLTNYFLTPTHTLYTFGYFPGIAAYPSDPPTRTFSALANDTIYSLYCHKQQYWLGLRNELISIQGNTLQRYPLSVSGQKILHIQSLHPHSLALLTDPLSQPTVYLYRPSRRMLIAVNTQLGLQNIVSRIYTDKNYNLWVATNNDGLFCLPYPQCQHLSKTLEHEYIKNLTLSPTHQVYVSTQKGYYVFDNYKPIHKVNKYGIYRLSVSASGDLYYAAGKEGFKNDKLVDYITNGHVLPIPSSRELFVLTPDELYVSTSYNVTHPYLILHTYPKQSTRAGRYYQTAGSQYTIRTGYIDQKKQLWIATSRGLLTVRFKGIKGHTWTTFTRRNLLSTPVETKDFPYLTPAELDTTWLTTQQGLPDNDVLDIKLDSTGRIWIATPKGVCFYDKGRFTYMKEKAWLQGNTIRAILPDTHGTLWIATKKGLVYWDGTQTGIFTEQHGLTSRDVNCLLLDKKNTLWVGGISGIALIDLTEKIQFPEHTSLEINHIHINSHTSSGKLALEMGYQDTIRFDFQSPFFLNQPMFRIRLDNQAWQETPQPYAIYNNLRTGTHTFQVQVRTLLGEWVEMKQVIFYVQLPWKIIGLALVGGLGIVGIAFFGWNYRQTQKWKLNKTLAQMELQTLQAQLNPHFIFNALNAIQLFILDQDARKATKYLSEFAKLMRLFLESSKSNYITIEDELRLLRLYIDLEKLRFEQSFDYKIEVDDDVSEDWEIPSMLLQPFVENAINHGLLHKDTPGMLRICFQRQQHQLICTIEDDGVGRQKAMEIKNRSFKSYKSRAMQIIEEKLRCLDQLDQLTVQLSISDRQDAAGNATGTLVTLTLPILE